MFALFLISAPMVANGQTVTATWDPSPPADQVTSYEVCVGTSSMSCNVQLATVSNTQVSYTFTPTVGVLHYVAVRAVNPSGTGSYSTEATFSIPSFTQPLNQSNPVGVAIAALTMQVSDPDGTPVNFTHTGLPTGLALNSATSQVTGTPSAAGTYNVTIFATDPLVTVSRSFLWTITAPAVDTTAPAISITSHTSGQTVSSASATIAGTATDSGRGGSGVTSVTVNGQAASGGTVSGNATASWSAAVALTPGANTISVQASDSRGNMAMQQMTLNYTIAPVSGATLTASVPSPQNAGTAITLTAGGSGGVTPRQFKFLVQPAGSPVQIVRDWNTATSYTWIPATPGTYTVVVWARSAGVTADVAQASAQMAYVINTPPPAPVTSVTLASDVATPQTTGTAITFTAAGAGGVAPREYKFLVRQGNGANQIAQNWGTSATFTWTPATAASYTVTVWARSAGVTTDAAQASAQMTYVINTPPVSPVTGATLTSNVPSPQTTGTAITFTSDGSGGVAPRQFKFFVQQGTGAPQLVQNWSTSTTYTWTPTTTGSYTVSVWARSAGVTVDAAQATAQMAFVVNAPPVSSVALTAGPVSPQRLGTAITLGAAGSGGAGPRQFKLFVQPSGASPQVVRDWSTATTYTWNPANAGSYTLIVWARSAGVTADAPQASATMPYVIDAAPAPLSIMSLTPDVASPRAAGTAVTFTAAANGGTAPHSFKWWLFDGANWTMVRDWSTSSTYTWTPVVAGNYRIGIWARDAATTADVSSVNMSVPYSVTGAAPAPPSAPVPSPTPSPGPVSITGLTSDLASPQVAGATVTFTAAASGGQAPYQFKWWIYNGISWSLARDWSPLTTFAWTPSAAGNYRVGIWARDASTTADVSNVNLSVPFAVSGSGPAPPAGSPLVLTGLTSSVASPQIGGTSVTFTAAATGGTAPYQFKWWLFDGVNWRLAANWTSASTFTWTPTAAGSYRVGVWVRDSTTTADVGTVNLSMPYTITSTVPLRVTSIGLSVPAPVAGAQIFATAQATGGHGTYQFKWWIHDGQSWTMARDWGAATLSWTPPTAGNYIVGVWAREANTKDNSGAINLSVPVVVR